MTGAVYAPSMPTPNDVAPSPAFASPVVISIVAKSKTGKTTLIERLLPGLKQRGLRVGVLKHHSHQSSFDTPGKDTHRLAEAGADVVVGVSPVQVATFRREEPSDDLGEIIERECAGLDLVLTEGYKRGPFPKIEVHRAERSPDLICAPEELFALVTDQHWPLDVPQFGLDDIEAIGDYIADSMQP